MTDGRRGISRRKFIVWSGTAAGAAVVTEALAPLVGARADEPVESGTLTPSYTTTVRRPADQCVLFLQFYNVAPDFSQSPAVFTKVDSSQKNYLVVNFGPPGAAGADAHERSRLSARHRQAGAVLGEEAGAGHGPRRGPHRSRRRSPGRAGSRSSSRTPCSGRSAAHPLVLTSASLLNWVGYYLSVAANALPPFQRALGSPPPPSGIGPPAQPSLLQTAIEMPTG